jgi:hypothetical protein
MRSWKSAVAGQTPGQTLVEDGAEARVFAEENLPKYFSRNYGVAAIALLSLYVFVRDVVGSTGKTLWYDELLTRIVILQGSWKGMMAALWGPMDGQPPLFYGIERWASRLAADPQMALRLPSVVAMACIVWCVFVYARRKGGALVGLSCAAFLLITDLFRFYAMEARPYAMTVACIALALVAYQRAESRRWLVVLGMSLALAEALHYMAVLSMVPFGLAEIAETLERKKVRWGVWIALVCGVLPLALTRKLLLLNKAYYGPHHIFLGFRFVEIPQMYHEFFHTTSAMGTALALTAIVGIAATAFWNWRESYGRDGESGAGEAVLLAAMAGLPFFALVFAKTTHAAMTSRYVECTVLGVALGFGYLLRRASRKALLVFAAFVIFTVAVGELHFWRFAKAETSRAATMPEEKAGLFAEAGHPELPIAMANGTDYLWMTQFGKAAERARLFFVMHDPGEDRDTLDAGMMMVQQFAPVRVWRESQFAAEHPRFLVYTEGPELGQDWLTQLLMQRGWEVKLAARTNEQEVYLVSRDGPGRE